MQLLRQKQKLNLSWLVIYLGISSAVINPALAFAPILVGGMVMAMGFSTNSAVMITSAELVASALSFIPALWWSTRISWRKIATISIVAVMLGNLLSIVCDTFIGLLIVRAVTGLFEGNLLILYMLVAAQVSKTEQLFGGKLALQMISVVIGLAIFPQIVAKWGVAGVYAILAAASGSLLVGVKLLPNRDDSNAESMLQTKIVKPTVWGALSLFALLMFAAGINVVWTYLERIGAANDLSLSAIGLILAAAIFLSILCGLISSSIGVNFGRLLPISIGLLAGVVGCLILRVEEISIIYFLAGVFLIAIAKVLPLPYLFGCLAILDVHKQLAIFSHVVLSLGMAMGPMLIVMFSREVGYDYVLLFSITVLSLTLMLALKLVNVIHEIERA